MPNWIARWLWSCVGISLLVGASVASAQRLSTHAPWVLRHFGNDAGLSQSSVNVQLQTHDGFLWLGTFGGLFRFDGHTFRAFPVFESDGRGNVQRILSLHEDAKHRLWVGTESAGLALQQQGRILQLPLCQRRCHVYRLFSEDEHHVWALTSDGVLRIDVDSLQATRISDRSHVLAARMGTQWWVAGRTGLARVQGSTLVPVALPEDRVHVYALATDAASAWVVTEGGRLYRYVHADQRWTFVRAGLLSETTLLSDGRNGVYLSDRRTGTRRLRKNGDAVPLAQASHVYAVSLAADAQGTLWLGTSTQGLFALRPSRFSQWRLEGQQAPGRVVTGDGAGTVWLAFGCAQLWQLTADGQSKHWPIDLQAGAGCIHSLLYRKEDGALWIGTSGGTLLRFLHGRMQQVRAWPSSGEIGVWRGGDDTLWLATPQSVERAHILPNSELGAIDMVSELAGMEVKRIVPAHAGGMWVVGDLGAFRVDGTAVVERWTSAQGIQGRFFRAIYEDAAGTVWIGSYGNGLFRIAHGRVQHYTEANGGFDNTISCLIPDAAGRLWFAGNRGLGVLLPQTAWRDGPALRTLTAQDGLSSAEFNGGTSSPCTDDGAGHLWFAMMEGFVQLTPAALQDWVQGHPPKAYIDRVMLGGKEIDSVQPIVLGVNVGGLEIRFGAIDLLHQEKVRFRYRIRATSWNADSAWIDAGATRNLLLSALPWGAMTLEVQARELGGIWSQPAVLHLVRPRPWYRHMWVWLAISLVSLLALLRWMRNDDTSGIDAELLEQLRAQDPKSGKRQP